MSLSQAATAWTALMLEEIEYILRNLTARM